MSKERQTYKIAGPATWELIRAAYLAGESAPALAERYGVSEHAIRKRISVEKWSKRAYAEALEARGLAPPPRAKTLNVAERFAAHYAPPAPPPAQEHPFMELVSALKEASAAAEGAQARVLDEAAAMSPSERAAELEKRALAQVANALDRGKANDAKALASIAEQMRRRVQEDAAAAAEAQAAEAEAAVMSANMKEEQVVALFRYAAFLAHCMLRRPESAPAIYADEIAKYRRETFGEGDEEALARAKQNAAHARRYFNMDEQAWQAALSRSEAEDGEGASVPECRS